MRKLLMLTAAGLVFQAAPVFAESGGDHGHGHDGKGKFMEKVDTNGDGVISKSEFLAQAEEKFSKIDKDGNGEISKEEGKAARQMKRDNMRDRVKERREERRENKNAE